MYTCLKPYFLMQIRICYFGIIKGHLEGPGVRREEIELVEVFLLVVDAVHHEVPVEIRSTNTYVTSISPFYENESK